MRERKNIKAKRETGDTLRSGGGKACSDDKSRPSFYFVTGRNAAAIICHRVCFKAKKKGVFFLFLIVVVVTGDVCDAAERKLASANDQL